MTTLSAQRTLTIGTRASKLALVQTEMVRAALMAAHPDVAVAVTHITTKGDVVLDRALKLVGGKGLFITEIEDAMRAGTIDLAVHSAKDLPTELPDDMALAAFLPRIDVRDVVISRDGTPLAALQVGARIGTSSARRACQIRRLRPDATILDLRGNVDTRIRKLREGQYDAIVLAAAGLIRLGMREEITDYLEPDVMLPAVAQGAIAIEVRARDTAVQHYCAALNDTATWQMVQAERAFLGTLGGGCSVPVGAYARINNDHITLSGLIGALDGRIVHGTASGTAANPAAIGKRLARRLLARGGRELLAEDRDA